MAQRAYKTLRAPMTVPEGFTLEPVDVIIPTTPEEPQDNTTVMIPLTVEQYSFMTTTVTTEVNQVQKIPGYMRCPTLGLVGMLHSIMDCVGYTSWLTHEGHAQSTWEHSLCTSLACRQPNCFRSFTREGLRCAIEGTLDRFCSYTRSAHGSYHPLNRRREFSTS